MRKWFFKFYLKTKLCTFVTRLIQNKMIPQETIVALATPSGAGAIAIIRLSGKEAITITAEVFQSVSGKDITKQKTHTIHLGHIVDGTKIYDQVLLSIFKGPNSYTGENVIEISCHGSTFIQQQIIQLLLRKGAKMAQAGEFTLRAFLNGKLDLSQSVTEIMPLEKAAEALDKLANKVGNPIRIVLKP